MTPIVTVLGLDIGILIGGAILTETVFNIPGIGRLTYRRDPARRHHHDPGGDAVPGARGRALNLFVDIMYAFLDPRVRLS